MIPHILIFMDLKPDKVLKTSNNAIVSGEEESQNAWSRHGKPPNPEFRAWTFCRERRHPSHHHQKIALRDSYASITVGRSDPSTGLIRASGKSLCGICPIDLRPRKQKHHLSASSKLTRCYVVLLLDLSGRFCSTRFSLQESSLPEEPDPSIAC
jgi:hypothetical protein